MATATTLYVNDYDVSRLGFYVDPISGHLDLPGVADRTGLILGRMGRSFLSSLSDTSSRTPVSAHQSLNEDRKP